jgi:hypothetical protein
MKRVGMEYILAFIVFLLAISLVLFAVAFQQIPRVNTTTVSTEKIEYFDYDWSGKWSPLDRKAREGNDCKPAYKVQRMLGTVSTWIWMMPRTCEEGLPHTRGIDVIALPIDLPESHTPKILAHEKIHLLQRMNGASWKRFYRQKWFYEIYSQPPVGMPEELIERRRANPDTSDEPWCCWKNRWWPVAIYKRVDKPTLKGASIRWWDSKTTEVRQSAPEDWVAFFGDDIHQNEHPHEISAEFLSGPLYNNGLPPNPSPAMTVLRQSWTEDADAPTV